MKDEMAMMVGKMASILMMSRTYAHMCHLKTGSYAKHIALKEFYDADEDATDVGDYLDLLVEVAQGRLGKIDIPFMELKGNVNDPIAGLEMHLTMIENVGKRCEGRALNAIVDEIIGFYLQTLYKLKELD